MDLTGKKVIVVGLGASGEAAARSLLRLGASVWVTEGATTDAIEERAARLRGEGVVVETGGHSFHDVDAHLAVVSPGIPPSAAILQHLRAQGVAVVGEVELAYRLMDHPIIAVTGTNGKTTTTALIARMIEEGGRRSLAAGNIGTPLIEAASAPEGTVIAAEVSSFQLASIERFRPRVAVILNIAEDHIDWHGSLDAYARAKARIFENQAEDDVLIYNANDELVSRLVSNAPSRTVPFSATGAAPGGIGVEDDRVAWRETTVFTRDDVPMPGAAGLEDALAAAGAVLEFGVDPTAVVRGLKSFEPLPHRMQVVAILDGVTYIDDSKATNPHAALSAVRGLENVVLIAGGRAKGIDLSSMRAMAPPVTAVIAIGEATEELERVFAHAVPVERAADMSDAVERARARSVSRGSVLLAPGCASLDMFDSYVARGNEFVRAVRTLIDRDERSSDGHA
jgi:UDP-N-acetylmuramoylalanine--D-glutamate ligase